MPPWLPVPGHGEFAHERRLRDDDIARIQAWAAGGAPEGEPSRRPTPPAWPAGGWQLGKPDLVVTAGEPYALQPGTRDVFRNFVLPVPDGPRRYVRAVEFRVDDPRVLHHANVGVDAHRSSRRLDRADPLPGFATMPDDDVRNVFGWSPGKVPILEPADAAWVLDEGSDLVVQLHMVASKRAASVRPVLGLYLTDTPPTRAPIVIKLESKAIDIPAGESNYVVEDQYTLPVDVDAVSVYPHAHALARTMEGRAVLPDGRETPLLLIRDWDIRWQDQYRYRTPVALPRGTTVRMRFTYDNSAANGRNPSRPPVRVRWGANSTDEMAALWLEVVPRQPQDAAVLERDYEVRSMRADIAGAALRVRVDPRDVAARQSLAVKLLQAGQTADAISHLEEALRLAPHDADVHSNLGTALQASGRLGEAMAHLAEAVRLRPMDDRLRVNLANGHFAAGRIDAATAELTRALALNDENADAHFNLAVIAGPRGQIDAAIRHLRRAIAIDPQRAEAHRNLAVAYGLQGRIEDAIREDRTALRLMPGNAAAGEHLNRLLAVAR
jgi:tetratricopeptide (TPR) repeat protein